MEKMKDIHALSLFLVFLSTLALTFLLPFIVFGLTEPAEWAATFTSWVMVACRGWWHF